MNKLIFLGLLFWGCIFCRCGEREMKTGVIRDKTVILLSAQQTNVDVKISDWNSLQIISNYNLPEYCSACIIALFDTTIKITNSADSLFFSCPPTGLNTATAISFSCYPPQLPGAESSGGGDYVLQWDTLFVYICKDKTSADSASFLLNLLRSNKKIKY
jgi:hypothetical protein